MRDKNAQTLINPQNGNLAFKIYSFSNNSCFDHVQRFNYYTLVWLQEGSGTLRADFSEYTFEAGTLFAFAPYQPFMFQEDGNFKGMVINFHPDFFCIYKHHEEVSCNGVLFNNIYDAPFVKVDVGASQTFSMLFEQMKQEMLKARTAQQELLVSYLKIFLITASRLKTESENEDVTVTLEKGPFVLQHLKENIEKHYRKKRLLSEYADMLHITPKALGKIIKSHFNKTFTNLISERIVIEAKRELFLTNKPVKEIAFELGFDDEHYFSRFFKNNAEVSPQLFRDSLGGMHSRA